MNLFISYHKEEKIMYLRPYLDFRDPEQRDPCVSKAKLSLASLPLLKTANSHIGKSGRG